MERRQDTEHDDISKHNVIFHTLYTKT